MKVKETYIVIDVNRYDTDKRLATIYETVDNRFFYDATRKDMEIKEYTEITQNEAEQIIEKSRILLAIN